MKRIFTFLVAILLIGNVSFAQNESGAINEGVLKVKFNADMAQKFDDLLSKAGSKREIMADTKAGYVKTGITEIDQLNQEYGVAKYTRVFRDAGKFEQKHREHGLHLWYKIEFTSKAKSEDLVSEFKKSPNVQHANPEYKAKRSGVENTKTLSGTPNDPKFSDQWHYENTGQNSGTAGCDISLLEAWTVETGNSNVIVAVEDGGVDTDHADLVGNMWINTGEIAGNGIDDDNNGYVDDIHGYNFADNTGTIPADDHGTHVAGTIAAETNNGTGVSGVAGGTGNNDGVRIMSCAVFANSNGGFEEAYTYAADNGAVISQNSWGYTSKGVYDQAVLDAIDYFIANAGSPSAAMDGGIVIFAAGNDGSSGQWWPGCYDNVLAVAATNKNDERSYYSNYDTWVDIAAPGGELETSNTDPTAIHSTYPNDAYGVMQGTSMACPHVSGVAALIISHWYGNITPQQVFDKLVNTTDNIDAQNPSYVGKLGSGRLNAFAALEGSTTPDTEAPTTPTNLSSSNITESSVVLSWTASTDNVGVTGYDVFKDGALLATATGTNYSVTGLTASTTYSFYVKAKDAAGNISAASNTLSVTTATPDTEVPTAPTNLTSSNIGETSVDLSWTASTDNVGVTGYDVYKDGTYLANTSGTSYSVTGLTASTTYSFYVKAKDAAGNASASSNTISVTTNDAPIEYCTSQGNNYSYEWIKEVTIGTYTNASNAAGYTDFTSENIPLEAGTDVSISLTPGFKSSTYNEYWKIWIDYNADGDFEDANELAFDAGSMSKTTVTGIINVLSTASGSTRMRISMKYNGSQTACETFTYGEVEDYTVTFGNPTPDTEAPTAPSNLVSSNIEETSFTLSWNASTDNVGVTEYDVYKDGSLLASTANTSYNVTGLTAATTYSFYVKAKDEAGNVSDASATLNVTTEAPDTEAPTAPANLASSNVAQTSLTLSWNASTDNVGVTGYDVYKDGSLLASTANTSYDVTGLTAATTYSFYVKAKDEAGNTSAASATLNVTTLDQIITYCSSKGNNSYYEWIDLVRINEIDNSTGNNGGYADFTSMTANVTPGSSQTIYVSCGFRSSSYTEYWHVWIDWDHSGTFDSDERMVYGSSSSSGTLSGSFTVPSDALLGTTRMRVTMKYNAAATSCETFSYGEVEDYTINVTNTSGASLAENDGFSTILGNEEPTTVNVFPNPASSYINVNISNGSKITNINIYNVLGALVKVVEMDGNEKELDISDLAPGSYIISIEDEKEPIVKQFIKK